MEIISSLITVSIALSLFFKILWLVFVLLMIRGFFDMTTKVARNIGLKLMVEQRFIKPANNFIMGSNFLGQALGSLLGFLLIGKFSIIIISVIDAQTFLISAFICLFLPRISIASVSNDSTVYSYLTLWRRGYQAIILNRNVFVPLFYLLMTTIVLQSFNQVARTWIPLAWLKLPISMGALSEALGCAGIVVGLVIVNFFSSGERLKARHLKNSFFIAIFSMLLPFSTHSIMFSFSFYFLYMMLFEVSYMTSLNQLLYSCKVLDAASIMVIVYGVSFGGMTLITFLIAAMTDLFGLLIVTCILLIVAVLVAIYFQYRLAKNSNDSINEKTLSLE